MKVIINPGSGPISGTREGSAIKNIKHFILDCGFKGIEFARTPEYDDDGRYSFILWMGQRCHTVDMPGLPLDKVRYMDEEDQNIWDYPRVYVDGSSWVWKFAILDSKEDWKEYEGVES